MSFQNQTEEFVFKLCRETFLSLWSYANPRRHGSTKELCDVLVICDPHILIISVKEYEFSTAVEPQVAARRWSKKAIDKSVKQIYGAERNLTEATQVTRADGSAGLNFPSLTKRKIHRISVSLGAKGLIPLAPGNLDRGFVHVFDEKFVEIALRHLNTISDLIHYLEQREHLVAAGLGSEVKGGEENLLAAYLCNGRSFPLDGSLKIEGGEWAHVSASVTYQQKMRNEEQSFYWDRLVDHLAQEIIADQMEFGGTLSENEEVIRTMARENRFARRILTEAMLDFRKRAPRDEVSARMLLSPSGVGYVFFDPPASYTREARRDELLARCFIARGDLEGCQTVIGIGRNVKPVPGGFAADLLRMSIPDWSDEYREKAERLRNELGMFKNPVLREQSVDEYQVPDD